MHLRGYICTRKRKGVGKEGRGSSAFAVNSHVVILSFCHSIQSRSGLRPSDGMHFHRLSLTSILNLSVHPPSLPSSQSRSPTVYKCIMHAITATNAPREIPSSVLLTPLSCLLSSHFSRSLIKLLFSLLVCKLLSYSARHLLFVTSFDTFSLFDRI